MATNQVGGLNLPVPYVASLQEIGDNVLKGLIAYYSFWIKDSIDNKLSSIIPTSHDAVPVSNRFPWNPEMYFVQDQFPALYCWEESSTFIQQTITYYARQRTIAFAYFFDELVGPGGLNVRHGLIPSIDAAVHFASDRDRHPGFGYGSDPVGTPIWKSLGLLGLDLIESQPDHIAGVPDVDGRSNVGKGHVVRFYPCLRWKVRVLERMQKNMSVTIDPTTGADTGADPSTLTPDIELGLYTGDTVNADNILVKEVILPHPDGSDPEQ